MSIKNKIIKKTFSPIISSIIVSIILILINILVNFPFFNYYIIIGFFLGAFLGVFINRKKEYIVDFSVEQNNYKIIYYTSFGIKKTKYKPTNSQIDFVIKRFLFEKISLIKLKQSDKIEIFYSIDDNIIYKIKKEITNYR